MGQLDLTQSPVPPGFCVRVRPLRYSTAIKALRSDDDLHWLAVSTVMLARIFSFVAGFFVYVALLLCFVQVPPQINKPLLAGVFAAIGAICAIVALATRSFAGWRRTLGAILMGASLTSAAAIGAITLLRHPSRLRRVPGASTDPVVVLHADGPAGSRA